MEPARLKTMEEIKNFISNNNLITLNIQNYAPFGSSKKKYGAITHNGILMAIISKGVWYDFKKEIRELVNG